MRDIIFILGMGRSGTSMIARVLSLCGGALPHSLLDGSISNPKGHFEPLQALEINDGFLAAHGLTWFDPTLRLQYDTSVPTAVSAQFEERIGRFLADNEADIPLIVKEPRIAGLAPFWFAAAERGGWNVRVVIPVRHPHEVRQSLALRDSVPSAVSDALWIKYQLLAEQSSRGFKRTFVDYAAFLADWRGGVSRISSKLGIPLDARIEPENVDLFVDNSLRHHVESDDAEFDNPWLARFYSLLQKACRTADIQRGRMDELSNLYVAAERGLRSATHFVGSAAPPIGVHRGSAVPEMIIELINDFTEEGYLTANPDVAQAVREGKWASGLDHWLLHGRLEGRYLQGVAGGYNN